MSEQDKQEMSDHDLLIRIDERVDHLHRCLKDHLKKHWVFSMAAVSGIISLVTGIIVAFVKKF